MGAPTNRHAAMSSPQAAPPAQPDLRTMREIRADLGARIEKTTEPFMVLLGFVFLVCLTADFAATDMSEANRRFLNQVEAGIYYIYAIDFIILFLLSLDRWDFLKRNWLLALSMVLPALRPLRLLRSVSALRAITATRALGVVDRGIDNLQGVFASRAMGYMILLTIVVTLVGATMTYQVDHDHPGSDLTTYGNAVWWAATLITTINSGLDPVSGWGRVIGMVLRIYAMGVFGYLTASIAAYFIRRVAPNDPSAGTSPPADGSASPPPAIPALHHPHRSESQPTPLAETDPVLDSTAPNTASAPEPVSVASSSGGNP